MGAIDVVTSLSAEEFDSQYFQPGKPVIHKGGVGNKPSFQQWSVDFLVSKVGARPVRVNYCDDGVFDFNKKQITKLDMPLSEAVRYFCDEEFVNKSYYLQQTSIPHLFPELMGDLPRPDWNLASDITLNQNLWVGGAGCVSPLHHDMNDNFLVQVKGRKELVLFDPADSKYLYPCQKAGGLHISEVDLDNLDLERFPAVALAKPLRCVLEPGDVLFIPAHWWHHVTSLDMCISINYWWHRFDVREHSATGQYPVREVVGLIQLFLGAGCDINHKLVDGEPILLKAIKCGFANVVEALLSQGANPNAVSSLYSPGATALMMATERGDRHIVQLLLKYGADPSWSNHAAFALAEKRGDQTLMDLLRHPLHA